MAVQFERNVQHREPVPPPPTAGSRWWHYVLAVIIAASVAMFVLDSMAPHGMSAIKPGKSDIKLTGDYGATDDQVAQGQVRREQERREAERETR
jgi:hypothetical protein